MTEPQWPNVLTMLFDQAARFGDRPFLWAKRHGSWQPVVWTDVARQVAAIGEGLRRIGLQPGDRVLLVSENRPEWLIADCAIMAAGGVTVPAYTTNTTNDHRHILGDSGAAGAIVSNARLLRPLLPALEATKSARFVVTMDDSHRTVSDGATHLASAGWEDLEGSEVILSDVVERAQQVKRTDMACIIYTSGTGGAPKGVMLSHGALLHNCAGAEDALKDLDIADAIYLSFLPLSHSYEHTEGQFFPIWCGSQIYYSSGVEHLASDMKEVRPTIMTAVPRLYETFQTRIVRGVEKAGGFKKWLFMRTVALGRKRRQGKALGLLEKLQDKLVDRLVRDKVRAGFGGRLEAMVSGGAPLNPDTGWFFEALGLQILQGYGLTESGPCSNVNRPGAQKMHTVGPPLLNTEIRIADDGEILIRGELLMLGYWNNPEATVEVIRDGWLHTGDIGALDEDGHLMITDRKKDIIVVSGGDNVSPARLEGLLVQEPEIGHVMVYGDKRPHLVAIVVPDGEWLSAWATGNGGNGTLERCSQDPALHKAIGEAITRVNARLSNIEKIRRFAIADKPFSIDNGQLTPTLKIRRHIIKQTYSNVLEELYRN